METRLTGNDYAYQTRRYGGNRRLYLLGILIIVALVLILLVTINQKPINTGTSPSGINSSMVSSFLGVYNVTTLPSYMPKSSTGNYNVNNQLNSSCNKQTYDIGYFGNSTGISYPYFVSFSVSVINESNLPAYSSIFRSNNGYCRSIISLIKDNSTSIVSNYTYDGVKIYRRLFTGFTPAGLVLVQNESMPGGNSNLYWYMYTALYKNTKLELFVGGVLGNQNETANNHYMDDFVSRYLSSVGG